MSDLHKAAQQALEALEAGLDVNPILAGEAEEALRAALAQQQAGSWQDGVLEGHLRERERWLAQEQAEPKGGGNLPPPLQAEPDLSLCPQCNGPADNGHDRSIPPNPYLCTKCMAEMPQPSYNVTVVDDAHPNGIPLEQWQNKPVKLTPWRCACGANLYIGADGAPRSKAEQPAQSQQAPLMQEIARLHDRVKDLTLDVEFLSQPPQRKPLSLTDLQEALVLTNLIDRDAIDDSDEYDDGSTLAQIDELYRIIIKERV